MGAGADHDLASGDDDRRHATRGQHPSSAQDNRLVSVTATTNW